MADTRVPDDPSPRYLTTEELAERYRTSPQTVRYWLHIGYGPPSMKIGRRRLYPLNEVERFESELQAPNTPA